tara:strand:- start:2850 stop:3302 length:453 start_codon:yes stop_codon:yes gene_type:complete
MPWVILTSDGLRDRLASDEFEALLAESPAPEAKLEEILEQVGQEIVSRVNAGRRKRGLPPVSSTGRNVPPGSQRHGYALARRLLSEAFPSLAEFNGDDRKVAVEAAETFMDDLAKNDADSDDNGAASFVSSSSSSFRYGGSTTMDFSISP